MRDSTLCYVENNGCYLMMHRVKKEHDINHDKWIGIGGGLEEGESPLDCVIREVREETGLELKNPSYRGLVSFCFTSDGKVSTEQMHLFTCSEFSGEIVADCDEGVLEWVPIDKVEDLPIWDGDRIFLRLLREEKRFFLLKLCYEGDELKSSELSFGGTDISCEKTADRNSLNNVYRVLDKKAREIGATLHCPVGYYNGHYYKGVSGEYEKAYFPIPEVTVKGLCDIEIGIDKISITTKLTRDTALAYDYGKIKGYDFEVYGVENYLEDYYTDGCTIDAMLENIRNSDEKDIGFSFSISHEMSSAEICEFVGFLRSEGFFY